MSKLAQKHSFNLPNLLIKYANAIPVLISSCNILHQEHGLNLDKISPKIFCSLQELLWLINRHLIMVISWHLIASSTQTHMSNPIIDIYPADAFRIFLLIHRDYHKLKKIHQFVRQLFTID